MNNVGDPQIAAMSAARANLAAKMEHRAAQVLLEYLTEHGLAHLDTDIHRSIPEDIDITDPAYECLCDSLTNLNGKLFEWISKGTCYRVFRTDLEAYLPHSRKATSLDQLNPEPISTTIGYAQPERFLVDNRALEQWIASDDESLKGFLLASSSGNLARDLSAMVNSACESGVVSDMRSLAMEIIVPDSEEGAPGFYVMVRNKPGDHRQTFLATGFHRTGNVLAPRRTHHTGSRSGPTIPRTDLPRCQLAAGLLLNILKPRKVLE
ncbi:hypothetical protein [Mycobacteroides abscessus]